ncbi:alpha/beta hydrolase [Streptomyces sp. NPDC018031]|uniref:alpha/beta hydrolase n=1 Tax=Streptomyces sp. NPDC018031 TaxID=3365033 RepID=UPI0037B1687F
MITSRPAVRRLPAAGLALAACLTASPALATAATPAEARTGPGLDRFYQQRLAWGRCATGPDDTIGRDLDKAGAQCADVAVPLDYADPQGRTVTVAISRLKATDTRHRIGSILLNNGGPGGTAVESPPSVRAMMKEVGPRYDIIGFDPRFVGRSTPLDCHWPVGTAMLAAGPDRESFDGQVALQKDLAAKCRATNASVLPHVNTRNTARDMDVIRGALGERKVSYLGYSYGSYLGTVYTQMFPGRFDRMVLDGAIDPRRYGPLLMRSMVAPNRKALADWAGWAARHHGTYRLGDTRDRVLDTVDRILAESGRRPLTVGTAPDTFRVDATRVPFLVFVGLASDTEAARTSLAEHVAVLKQAADGQATRLSPEFAETLRVVLTGEYSSSGSAQTAILCGDGVAPRDPEVYWRDIERSRDTDPLFGPYLNNINPCAFWDEPRERPTEVRRDADPLIVNATGDTRTPYDGAVALHRLLPGSKLITLRGANQHGVYGEYGNACVDDKVNRYLATGRLPARDQSCTQQAG